MTFDLRASIVRILKPDGSTAGTGFVVSDEGLIVTCAHVVQAADSGPDDTLGLVLYSTTQPQKARVERDWWRDPDEEDVAILRLESALPEGVEPLPLGSSQHSKGHEFNSRGFRLARQFPSGLEAEGKIQGNTSYKGYPVLQLLTNQIDKGMSGAPIWDVQARRVAGMVNFFWETTRHIDAWLAFATPTETLRDVCPELRLSDICPYRSLDAFTETDTEFFFGRQRVVDRLVASLRREPRFLAVLGPSGSGKSSLVQAGLIPQLRQSAVPGSDGWGIIVTRPADQPFGQLFSQGLTGASKNLTRAVQSWLERHPGRSRLALVIDQFEEVLVICAEPVRQSFFANLQDLLKTDVPITIVQVMRDEFYSRFAGEAPALVEWLERGLVNVPLTLERDELRAIIEEPVARVGSRFETGLIEVVLNDALESAPEGGEQVGRSTVLPLLEFALTELWERRQDGVLTHKAYEAIGGVTGGLAQWADRAYYGLEEEQQQLARQVLTELVHLGDESQGVPDSRRRRPLDELTRYDREPKAVRLVVRRMADARLVVTGRDLRSGDEFVELIHDALLREWQQLRVWLEEDRRFLKWRQEIERRTQAWFQTNPKDVSQRDDGKLLRGGDLAVAEDWLKGRSTDLNQPERQYIQASLALRERETTEREAQRQRELEQARKLANTQRQRAIVLAVGLIIAAVLSLVAFSLFQESRRNLSSAEAASTAAEQQRQVALSRQLAAQSVNQLSDSNYEVALLLAIEAGHAADTAEAYAVLRQIFVHPARSLLVLSGHGDDVWQAAWNADESRILTVGSDGTARVWDAATGKALLTLASELRDVGQAAWSPNGSRILTTGSAAIARVWETEDGKELAVFYGYKGIGQAVWNADGSRILLINGDGAAYIWEPETEDELAIIPGPPGTGGYLNAVDYASWNADESRILTLNSDGAARVWDAKTGEELLFLGSQAGWIWQAVWDRYERRILTAGCDRKREYGRCLRGGVRVWDAETGRELLTLYGHTDWVNQASWNADESRILTASADGTARVWNAETGEALFILTGHTEGVVQAVWNSDESRILTVGCDQSDENGLCSEGTLRLWDAETGEELAASFDVPGRIKKAVWNSDESYILVHGADGTVQVWDPARMKTLLTLSGRAGTIRQVVWNADGSRILTASTDGTARVWNVGTGEELPTLTGHAGRLTQATWNPDESRILTASSDGTARVWDAQTGENLLVLSDHTGGVRKAVWSSNGSRILTASDRETVRVWDAGTGDELFALSGHTKWIAQAMWNADESRILTVSWDDPVWVWDAQTGEKLLEFPGHALGVSLAAWDADGSRILTAGCDQGSEYSCSEGSVRVWDAKSGVELLTLPAYKGSIKQAEWNAEGSCILTDGYEESPRIWDAETGEELFIFSGHAQGTDFAAWNPDGSRILTFSRDGPARVWDVKTGAELFTLSGYKGRASGAVWSTDESHILTVSGNTAWVWDAETGEELVTLAGHTEAIEQAVWNTDGNYILTAGCERRNRMSKCLEGTARVWDAETAEELMTLFGHTGEVIQAVWNADESRILTASSDGTARLWYTQMEDLLVEACRRAPRNMTREEWQRFMKHEPDYRLTCPNLPVPEE